MLDDLKECFRVSLSELVEDGFDERVGHGPDCLLDDHTQDVPILFEGHGILAMRDML